MAEAIYRRYRPMTFHDVLDQNHVKITVQNQISTGNVAHAYLFSGPRGVGKTTIARLLAKTLNCQNREGGQNEPCNSCSNCEEMNRGQAMDIVEIDAASNTGVDNVRENIIESIRFAPSKSKWKVFIIDEVHMLSTSAFNALLKTLEEPPAHALFILATTEIHKIPQTILSRCQRFDFHRIAAKDMIERLTEIAKTEGVTVEADVLKQIARLSEGCLRDAESLLGQILALGETHITNEHASIILPVTNTTLVIDLVQAIAASDVKASLNLLNDFVDQGGAVKNLIDEVIDFVRTAMMLGLGAQYHDHYDGATLEGMQKMFSTFGAQRTSALLDVLIDVRNKPSNDAFPHLPLEIAIVLFASETSILTQTPPSLPLVRGGNAEGNETRVPLTKGDDRGSGSSEVDSEPIPDPVPDVVPEPSVPESPNEVSARNEHASSNIDLPETEAQLESAPQSESSFTPPENPREFSIDELKGKWGRCCAEIKKRSIALPLALQGAELLRCEEGILYIGFKSKFHFDNIDQVKNTKIIADAVNEVMQSNVHVKPELIVTEEDKTVDALVDAFGGAEV